MSETKITMPRLGESVDEGTIARWLVKPGDRLKEFEPILEVDTDKVSAEVPSPVTGTLKQILIQEGETVRAGVEIAVVETGEISKRSRPGADETALTTSTLGADNAAGRASYRVLSPPEPVKDGSRGSQIPPAHGIEHGKEPPDLARSASAISSSLGKDSSGQFSPAVRALAREHGVDLEGIAGTGLGGRVTKKDVQRAIDEKRVGSPTGPTPQPILEDHAVPLTRVRKLIAENVTRSKATIPHAWQTQEVDMSGVVANRAANKGRFQQLEGYSLTYLPYVIKATASALREHPAVNATFNEAELIIHGQINIGISVGLENSVITPVLRQADQLTVAGIARAVGDFAQRTREGKVSADELQGATFTVNNSGTFGTLLSYSVIVPGQAGILTMEAIVERPVAVGGLISVKPMMYLCFSLDHRVMDGLAAARFLSSCRQWLEAVAEGTSIW